LNNYPSIGYIIVPFVVVDLLLSTGFAVFILAVTGSQKASMMSFGVMVWLSVLPSLWVVGEIAQAWIPEVKLLAYELKQNTKFTETKEPDTLLINHGSTTHRIKGVPISEWIEAARILKRNNYRFRARTRGLDYDKLKPLIENNPYICSVDGGGVITFTDAGIETIDHLAQLPSDGANMRYSVIRRLSHTHTHGGEVV